MASHELKATGRETTGKGFARRMRSDGRIPAVAYGHKEAPIKLAIDARELRDLLGHGGSHGLVTLKVEGGADVSVIIKSIDRHPARHTVNSVDFLRVSLNETVSASVPIVLEGEPVGVKVDGGVLVQALHELQIEAFPQNIPEHIVVDVSHLEFNGAPIHVNEITMPAGVTAMTDGEESIAVVNPPEPEEVVEPTEAGEAELDADQVPSDHGAATTGGGTDKAQHGDKSSTPEKPAKDES